MSKVFYRAIITIILVFSVQTATSKNNIETNTVQEKLSGTQIKKNLETASLSFTENRGQWDEKVKFRANTGGATMWFGPDGAYYQFTRTVESDDNPILTGKIATRSDMLDDHQSTSYETIMIKANFIGANVNPTMVGVDMIDYKCNYFLGNDKSKWASDVPNYSAVMYEDIYKGIDLKYFGNGKQMEYDFIVSPGADFSQIKIQYEGAESVAVNDNGQLVVTTKWGEVVEQRPVIYQVEAGNRIAIDGKYLLQDNNSFSFELSDYDASLELVIDPVLMYSTYLGGSGTGLADELLRDIKVDSSGAVYIAGWQKNTDFPTINAYQGTYQGGNVDCFVSKLSSTGNSLIFSTYFGGDSYDAIDEMVLGSSGEIYIAGGTASTNFPILNSYQGTYQGGGTDAFVAKLSSSGNSLIYSTYLGGTGVDDAFALTVDAAGFAYVSGRTSSSDFPTLNPYQDSLNFWYDNFITKINLTGDSIVYSTYLGGNDYDVANAIAVNSTGEVYLTGITGSTDFPTKNPIQATNQGGYDSFIAKLNSVGDSLIYGTYLGGSDDETPWGLVMDASGAVYIAGETKSNDYPTANAYQGTFGGGTYDAFISKLNPSGSSLIYSTYLGGNSFDYIYGMDINSLGEVYVTGKTVSGNFPMVDPYSSIKQNFSDAFITKFNNTGTTLLYSTFLGGNNDDFAYDINVDDSGSIYVAGLTMSSNFPKLNAYQSTLSGGYDFFITKFSAVATYIQEYDIDNLPSDFNMSQNYPNPFNPTTTIEFNLPTKSNVIVTVYNLLGQEVNQLVNQEFSAGNYNVTWDGTSSNGVQSATGMYFYRIITDDFVETKKMLLLK